MPFKAAAFSLFPRVDGSKRPIVPSSGLESKAEIIEFRKQMRRRRNRQRNSGEEGLIESAVGRVLSPTVDHLMSSAVAQLLKANVKEKKKKALYGMSASYIRLENTRIESPVRVLARQESN